MSVDEIKSSGQFASALSSNDVVVVDFYADWCGPCKMIGPHFERLAQEHARPKKMAFVKVNTDKQNDVSGAYGVRSLPTFKVFHNGACIETVTGANPAGLAAAITKAKNLLSTTGEDIFKSKGHKIGGSAPNASSSTRASASASSGRLSRPSIDLVQFFHALVSFVGLYFVSLFAMDSFKAANESQFSVNYDPRQGGSRAGAEDPARAGAQRARTQSKFKTFSDL